MSLSVVVLAAGKGSRMQSTLPKVLHTLAGEPLLGHVLNTAKQLNPSAIYVVTGHGAEQVKAAFASEQVHWVEQKEQLGTAHALAQAVPLIPLDHQVLVLSGDVPLIQASTLASLVESQTKKSLGLITVDMSDPTGLGRILRNEQGKMLGIVEHKDASNAQRQIIEINSGIYCFPAQPLAAWLDGVGNHNAQGEYYLTDLIAMSLKEGFDITTLQPTFIEEVSGVNTKLQLADLERLAQRRRAEALMAAGVTILDPSRIDLRGNYQVASDVTLDVNVILEGNCRIGAHSYVGPNTLIKDSDIDSHVQVQANCVLDSVKIASGCSIGPFARLRPGSEFAENAKVGNFVETKNVTVGANSKVNHLSYLGDAKVGDDVNVGAGTITCNYDGVNKHKTTIHDGAFIGSNTALVAPVTIGNKATVGAGSTITKDVSQATLGLSRSKQLEVPGWTRPEKDPEN